MSTRILVLATDFPWPANTGYRRRLAMQVEALAEMGDVELFAITPPGRREPCELPEASGVVASAALSRARVVPGPLTRLLVRPPGPAAKAIESERLGSEWLAKAVARAEFATRHAWSLVTAPLPADLPAPNAAALRDGLRRFARPPYDLVWSSRPEAFIDLGCPRLGRTVLDLDDLEFVKLEAMRAHLVEAAKAAGLLSSRGLHLRAAWAASEARRWRHAISLAVSRVDLAALCSEEDAARLALLGCAAELRVVPNGYPAPRAPAGSSALHDPPVVALHGHLWYGPNRDAALVLVNEVGPRLRRLVPGVQVRLIGEAPPELHALHDPPRVVVTGGVKDMAAALAEIDLVAAPIPYGSGTRTKLVEAFAHRIPVVSSTVGAEGLGAEHGQHLLLADAPGPFAVACSRLLGDAALRRDLAGAAQALFEERFEAASVKRAVSEAAASVLSNR
ncbi:MAG: glycosyltransferase family 4 protein [Acidimicrobiales bacterium]